MSLGRSYRSEKKGDGKYLQAWNKNRGKKKVNLGRSKRGGLLVGGNLSGFGFLGGTGSRVDEKGAKNPQ